MKVFFKQIRIKEWIKNGFIFMPVFFAGRLGEYQIMIRIILGFLSFCFAASSIYCINDLLDVEQDKLHLIKCKRPYPNGQISKQNLLLLSALLFMLSGVCCFTLPMPATYILAAYFVLQILYSIWLKHIPVLDCVTIALGFVSRILFGGLIVGFIGTSWIFMVTFLLSLYLAFAKRRCEIALGNGNASRISLQYYSLNFLDIALGVTCAITIVSYVLYTHDPEVNNRIHFPYFYVSAIFVVVGMLRHLQQTILQSGTESPTDYLLKDPITIINILMWLGFNAYILYR